MAKPAQNLYFVAIIPGGMVYDEVMDFKKEILERFQSKGALRSPPHITLHMPFKWRADREEQLLEVLSGFECDQYPFEVQLNGFDFFDSRVVYVNVIKSVELADLQKRLIQYMRRELRLLNADYKDRGFHPHMTIGFRDLKKSLFPQVKQVFTDRPYDRSFTVSHICLLQHDGHKWHLCNRF